MGVRPIAPDDLLAGTVQSKTVAGFGSGTPLWFYILGESEAQGGLRLGTVGGRIVADVFLGMLRADQHGLLHSRHLGRFRPAPPIAPEAGRFGLADLAVFAGVAERP